MNFQLSYLVLCCWVGLGLICFGLNFVLYFFYKFETGSHTVFQTGLKLLCSLDWF